jgi:hypothetical protein
MIPLVLENVSLYFTLSSINVFVLLHSLQSFYLTLYIIKLLRPRPGGFLFAHDTF